MKAIETEYKGYRFRSRLEARWAVFFDALRLTWEYEKEGFDLGKGGWFLPDFWVTDWQLWVEIKPGDAVVNDLWKMCSLSTRQPLMLVRGSPWIGEHSICFPSFDEDSPGYGHISYGEFTTCRRCEGISLLADDNIHRNGFYGFGQVGCHTCEDHDSFPTSGDLTAAYHAARSARFEHGEKPVVRRG